MLATFKKSSGPSIAQSAIVRPSYRRDRKAVLAKTFFQSALGAAMAAGVLYTGQAQALELTIGGTKWLITTFTGTYNDNASKFNLSVNGGVMPWWGNTTLANAFATAVNTQLGSPNPVAGLGGTGGPGSPYFAWITNAGNVFPNSVGLNFWIPAGGTSSGGGPVPGLKTINVSMATSYVWAQATPAVPGPLPLLGAFAAFSTSRQLRKRIKSSKEIGSSTATV